MLMRYVSIDKSGDIEIRGNPKIVYSTMMATRLHLMTSQVYYVAKSCLIAIRYGIVRTQFKTLKD